jgi:hypothetical protein
VVNPADVTTQSPRRRVPTRGAPRDARRLAPAIDPGWLRHWELWAAIALGAALRLWHVELTQFLDDQTGMMLLARAPFARGLLPITGMPYSIGVLDSPLTVYFIMPFAAFSKSPLPGVISIALLNIGAVALCYRFAYQYFGRGTAAVAALLLASCSSAVNYSRFLWEPNYIVPIVLAWAATLFAYSIQGKRRYLVPHLALLMVLILVHLIAFLLGIVTLIGVLLAPQRPRRRDYWAAGGIWLVLLAPTIMWEALSNLSDVRIFLHYLRQPSVLRPSILKLVYQVLGAPTHIAFDMHTPAAATNMWSQVFTLGAPLLAGAGYLALTILVARPFAALWYARQRGTAFTRQALAFVRDGWAGLRADAAWRGKLLLWLWVTVPIVALFHYSTASLLTVHYVLFILPALIITAGFALHLPALLGFGATATARGSNRARRMGLAILGMCLLGAVVGESTQTLLGVSATATGNFDALSFYGYPLAEMQSLDARLVMLQRQQRAGATFLLAPTDKRYYAPANYLLVNEEANRSLFGANCLVLPAQDEGPVLEVDTANSGPASAALASLPNVSPVTRVAALGGPGIPIYRASGAPRPMPGETAVNPVSYVTAEGLGLQLAAARLESSGLLQLRWSVIGNESAGQSPMEFEVNVKADGAARNPAVMFAPVDCQPTRLHAGETLFTWSTPVPPASGQPALSAAQLLPQDQLVLGVSANHVGWVSKTLGPLHLLSSETSGLPLAPVQPSVAATSGGTGEAGRLDATGTYQIGVSSLSAAKVP